jgi:hypothetical protein
MYLSKVTNAHRANTTLNRNPLMLLRVLFGCKEREKKMIDDATLAKSNNRSAVN